MIIKCTEEEKEFILKEKCPRDFKEIENTICCSSYSLCKRCFNDNNILFEIKGVVEYE